MTTVFYLTDTGIVHNEDFVYATKHYGVVVDGASGLYQEKVTQGNTDAQAFSHALGQELILRLPTCKEATADVLTAAIRQVNQQLFPATIDILDEQLPSCTFSCFRVLDNQLELSWVGDSPILVFTADEVHVYYDHTIEENDQQALTVFMSQIANGLDIAEAAIQPILLRNRQKKNKANGYWIVDPSAAGANHLYQKVFPLSEVKGVVICSDGFYRLMDLFQILKPTAALEQLASYDRTKAVIAELRGLENASDSIERYPRMKKSDDASVLVWFNPAYQSV